jgi:hypothetical protein
MPLTLASNAITFTDNTSLSSGIITTAQLSAGAVQQSFANTSGGFNFRNKIINGNFDIWQRGTSFTASEYGADRWINVRVNSTSTMSRQAFTLGQTAVPNEPTHFCRMVVGSITGSANAVNLTQRIEDVRTFAGKTVTASFWCKADTTRQIAFDLAQHFGSGGSFSSQVVGIGTTKVTVTSSWQKITITANMPSLLGKTIGTNNDNFVAFRIWFDAGSSFNAETNSLGHQSGTFDIAQVQLEEGSFATPFEQRPIGTELALCQRYYQYFPLQYINNVSHAITVYYKVTMRANPQITWGGTFFAGYPTGITTENFIGYSTTNSTNPLTLNAEL